MRRNVVLFALAVVALALAFFFLVWRPQSTRISETEEQAIAAEQQRDQLRLEIARLKDLRDRAPELRQQVAKLDTALPSDPQLAAFILQVQDAANASGIDWLSVSPSPPAAAAQAGAAAEAAAEVLVVNVGMNVTGGYFQVQDFIVRIENLARAVRTDNLTLGGGPRGLPHLSATFTMRMFVAAPPAPAAAATTEPGA